MAFSRINPAGWGVGDKLTSGQQNALDIDHAKALDKSVAGDTLSGVVTVSGTGAILANVNAAITVNAVAGILTFASSGITSNVAAGITPGVAGGITSNVAGGITASIAGGIKSGVDGGIQLSGTSADWPRFSAARTITRAFMLKPLTSVPTTIFQWSTISLAGSAATATGQVSNLFGNLWLPDIPDGATLTSVSAYFIVAPGHASLPTNFPAISVSRIALATGSQVFLASTDPQIFPNPANLTAYVNSGVPNTVTYTCNQNNVIDRTAYGYYLSLRDENAGGATVGNLYVGATLIYTASDMRIA